MNVSPVRFRKRLDRSFHTIYEELALVLVRLFAGNLQGVCQPSQENITPTDTLRGGGELIVTEVTVTCYMVCLIYHKLQDNFTRKSHI